jgi:hypothetical protein
LSIDVLSDMLQNATVCQPLMYFFVTTESFGFAQFFFEFFYNLGIHNSGSA